MDSGRRGSPFNGRATTRRERRNTALRTCIDRFALPLLPSRLTLALSLTYTFQYLPHCHHRNTTTTTGDGKPIHSPKLKRRRKISATFRSLILSCTAGRAAELKVLKFTSAFFRYSKMSPKWLMPSPSLPPMLCQCEITCQQ